MTITFHATQGVTTATEITVFLSQNRETIELNFLQTLTALKIGKRDFYFHTNDVYVYKDTIPADLPYVTA